MIEVNLSLKGVVNNVIQVIFNCLVETSFDDLQVLKMFALGERVTFSFLVRLRRIHC